MLKFKRENANIAHCSARAGLIRHSLVFDHVRSHFSIAENRQNYVRAQVSCSEPESEGFYGN